MSTPVLTLRSDSVAVAGSVPIAPVLEWVDCRYGESVDAADPCVLRLRYDSPIFSQLAVRHVLYLKNEVGEEYEYRVKKVDDDRSRPTRRVEAVPILHDLNDVLVTTVTPGGEVPVVSGTYTVAGWWAFVIAPALARKGITHWQLGTVDVDDAMTFTLVNESVLGLLRRFVAGSTLTLRARLSGGVYYLDMTTPSAAYRPLVWVGTNVLSLESEVDGDLQVTRVYPTGQDYPGGTPSGIGGTPWAIGGSGAGDALQVIDPEFGTADFAIETDQFAPNADAGFEGFAMVASRGTEINAIPATGSSVRWTESACAAKRRIFVPIQNATGELWVYDYETEAWLTPITVGDIPVGCCYAPSQNKVYVTTRNSGATDGNIKVIDPDTLAVSATIALGTTLPNHCLYEPSVDRVFVASNGGIKVIDPASNSVAATVTGGTSNQVYHLCVVQDELWGAGEVQHTKRYTLAATPVYVGEYDTGLESGVGSTTLCYDDVNDRVWLTFWTGNKLKVVTRATGVVHTTFNTGTTPNAGAPRWLYAYGGAVYTTHTTGRIARWDGATPAYVSITTVDASGGEYWAMSPLAPGESSVLIAGAGRRLAWWDLSTHSARVIRRIAGVVAGSPSEVSFGGGTSVPFADGDFTTLVTLDLLPVVSLPSPLAIATYGVIERPAEFPNARLVPNLVGHPGLDEWKTPGRAMAHWSLPDPASIGRSEADGSMALGLSITFSGTATRSL